MVGRGEEWVLVPHSEGQGSQRWILAVGLENSFPPPGAAPGCWALGDAEVGTAHESRNQVQSLLSAEVGLQATCAPSPPSARAPARRQLGEKPDSARSWMDL